MTYVKPGADALRYVTLDTLWNTAFPDREYLIEPVLRDQESMMLWAPSGLGKTMVALSVALAVAGGGSFLGWTAPKARKVLLVDGEMHTKDLTDRLTMLSGAVHGIDKDAAARNLTVLARTYQSPDAEFPDLGQQTGQDQLFGRIRADDYELVILDNFSTLANVADENDASAMSPVLAVLMRLKQAGVACLLVHHSGKTGATYRGSSKLATTFEVILGLKAPGASLAAAKGTAFETEWTKFRGRRTDATRSRLVHLDETEGGVAVWKWQRSPDDEALELVALLQTGTFRTQADLAAAAGYSTGKVSKLKYRAISLGLITEEEWKECLAGEVENADF